MAALFHLLMAFIFSLLYTTSLHAQRSSDWHGSWEGSYLVTYSNGVKKQYFIAASFENGGYILRNGNQEMVRTADKLTFFQDPGTNRLIFKHSEPDSDGTDRPGEMVFRFDGNNLLRAFGSFKSLGKKHLEIDVVLDRVVGDQMLEMRRPLEEQVLLLDATELDDFHEGKAIIRKGDRFAMITKDGKLFLPWGKYKFNMQNNYIIDNRLCGFRNGLCVVRDVETEKYGFINHEGKLVIPCTLSEVLPFGADGYGWGKEVKPNGITTYYFFDANGKRYIAKGETGSYNLLPDEPLYFIRSGNTYEFYHKTGRLVLRTNRHVTNPYSNGLIMVDTTYEMAGKKTGFIDTLNRLVVSYRKGTFENFYNGFALVTGGDADEIKYAFIDKNGDYLIQLKISDNIQRISKPTRFFPIKAYHPEDGAIAWVEINNKESYIDSEGKLHINFIEAQNEGMDFSKPQFHFNWGQYKSSHDMHTLPFRASRFYDKPFEFRYTGVGGGKVEQRAERKNTSGWGTIRKDGTVELWPVYESMGFRDAVSGLAKAALADKEGKDKIEGYIDRDGNFVILKKEQ